MTAGARAVPCALVAPAKLTVSLGVLGRRPDGYHELDAEMVTLDLHDVVEVLAAGPGAGGVEIVAEPGARAERLAEGTENLVRRALAAVGVEASVRLRKRIPVGGGLGGGSADAAAVLRWAGVTDTGLAARLGADVPFCVRGGRARVRGIGELVTPLPFAARRFVLLVPPFSVDTAAVYRAWDEGAARGPDAGEGLDPQGRNGLLAAALATEPRLARWGTALAELTGRPPVLAGSGSTWWVEGGLDELGLAGRTTVTLEGEEGRLFDVATVAEGWQGPAAP